MNCFEKAKAAADAVGIYSCPDVYTPDPNDPEGVKDRWITYNLTREDPELFGDDEAGDMTSAIQVHLFLPKNYNFFSLRKQLRDALMEQGFTFPHMVLNTVEEKIRHIVFECECDEDEESED